MAVCQLAQAANRGSVEAKTFNKAGHTPLHIASASGSAVRFQEKHHACCVFIALSESRSDDGAPVLLGVWTSSMRKSSRGVAEVQAGLHG
eukprot:1140423-Pelagomonas_calceolata.AAC.3